MTKNAMLNEKAQCGGAWLTGFHGPCREVSLRRSEEVSPFLDDVVAALAGLGYSPRDCTGVRLALEEAPVNALRHGNGGDPAKQVRVRYHIGPEAVLATVEDEGLGFDPDRMADPTLPENVERPGGRGLLLMRHFMGWVRLPRRGNCVTLCKRALRPSRPGQEFARSQVRRSVFPVLELDIGWFEPDGRALQVSSSPFELRGVCWLPLTGRCLGSPVSDGLTIPYSWWSDRRRSDPPARLLRYRFSPNLGHGADQRSRSQGGPPSLFGN